MLGSGPAKSQNMTTASPCSILLKINPPSQTQRPHATTSFDDDDDNDDDGDCPAACVFASLNSLERIQQYPLATGPQLTSAKHLKPGGVLGNLVPLSPTAPATTFVLLLRAPGKTQAFCTVLEFGASLVLVSKTAYRPDVQTHLPSTHSPTQRSNGELQSLECVQWPLLPFASSCFFSPACKQNAGANNETATPRGV